MKRENRVKRWLKHSVSGMIAGCLAISMLLASVPGIWSQAEEVVVQEETRTFVHPGMLHTAESFAAMKENVENGIQPSLDTWNQLKSNGFSAADWQPRQLETVVRGGDGNNCAQFYIDIRRAYQTALVWKISGSEEHGEAACRILNAWSSTMKNLAGSSDRFLAAGIYGYELANAAEIMRDHPSFDKASMEELLLNVFYPMNEDFLTNHNGAHIGNYWANWDLCNIAAMMSIGIFTDRADIYDRALTYYKTGLGNGSIYNAMPYVFEDGTVQWQESGRDQGHTTLGVSLCEVICEMAWNQGDDLYSLSDNRFLKAVEYIARYNNGEDVQYAPYQWLKGQTGSSEWQNAVSEAARGSVRPVYSMVYNHYVNRMGLSAPNIEKVLKEEDGTWKIEAEQSNGDEFGWQTLTFANTGKQTTAKKIQGDFEDGKYRIRSVLTGKSIVVNEEGNLASADAGTRADEWWTLTNTGDGEYIVTNAVTGKVMQINSDYYTYASVIGTGTKDGGLNQKFAFVKNDTGDYRIIPTANFFVLDLMNAGTTDDTPIIQYRNYSSSGQKWIIESVEEVEGIDVLADFTFDDEETGFVSGYGIAKGSYTLKEHNDGNALYLNGSSDFLEVTMKDGKSLLTGVKEMTVSFMAKPEAGTTNWAFYAAPNAGTQEYLKENYIGILESNGTVTTERYKNTNGSPVSAQTTVEEDGWYYLTVVYAETETIIYVNGEEKTRQASDYALTDILGDDSIVYIGKANWKNGEYYKGLIDNYSIRGRALSAEEVKEAYEEAKIPKVLAMFTFDDEESGFTNGYAVADGTYSLQEHDGGKALYLDGTSNYLDVKTLDGASLLTRVKEMTVSFQAKPEAGRANWPFYAAPDANGQTNQKERYLGVLEKDGTITAERYNNTNGRPSSAWTTTDAEDWYYVTVVQTEQETIIYINGEEKARQSSAYALTDILGENSILYIGKANWGNGEYYKGLIDNYTILSKALSAAEVKELAAQYVEEEPIEVVNKDSLKEAIAQAVPADKEAKYTEESWSRYEKALKQAETVYENKTVTQEDVDNAVTELRDAQAALEEKEEPQPPRTLPFVDVKEGDWFYNIVYYNYYEGLMTGLDETHFGPNDSLARAQFAVILWRMNESPTVAYEEIFPDVKDKVWYTDAILWAADTKVVTGYTDSGMFGPGDRINREQMAVMMYRYAKYMGYETGNKADFGRFNDAGKVSAYADEAMQWAVGNEIITGKNNGTLIDPQGDATRAECATIIMRFMEKYEK